MGPSDGMIRVSVEGGSSERSGGPPPGAAAYTGPAVDTLGTVTASEALVAPTLSAWPSVQRRCTHGTHTHSLPGPRK